MTNTAPRTRNVQLAVWSATLLFPRGSKHGRKADRHRSRCRHHRAPASKSPPSAPSFRFLFSFLFFATFGQKRIFCVCTPPQASAGTNPYTPQPVTILIVAFPRWFLSNNSIYNDNIQKRTQKQQIQNKYVFFKCKISRIGNVNDEIH